VRALPLLEPPSGCSLTDDGLAEQRGRVLRLVPSVVDVATSADVLSVSFAADVDASLVDELVAAERSCCTFVAIDYDVADRVLSISGDDAEGREVVDALAALFEEVEQ
jgi:hypothetical protein